MVNFYLGVQMGPLQLATPDLEWHSRITVSAMLTVHTRLQLYLALVTISNDLAKNYTNVNCFRSLKNYWVTRSAFLEIYTYKNVIVICFLLGVSRRLSTDSRRFGTLYRFHHHRPVNAIYWCRSYCIDLPTKIETIQASETSAMSTQTPGKHPKENILHIKHGESLKSRKMLLLTASVPRKGSQIWVIQAVPLYYKQKQHPGSCNYAYNTCVTTNRQFENSKPRL
jgi:hypothetical protein